MQVTAANMVFPVTASKCRLRLVDDWYLEFNIREGSLKTTVKASALGLSDDTHTLPWSKVLEAIERETAYEQATFL